MLIVRHFKAPEFRCGCGCGLGYDNMQDCILDLLDACREQAGIPFVVTSSIRCTKHNAAVGGADRSAHLTGYAVDISAKTGAQKRAILKAALALNAPRIGVSKDFIHIDTAPYLVQNVVWAY